MAYQTTYTETPPKGLPGQVANEENSNRISREVETASGIPFGAPAQRGVDEHGVAILSNGTFIGFAILTPAVPASASLPDGYPQYFTGAFMTQGTMYQIAGATVTPGQSVYWVPSTGRYSSASGGGNIAIPDCVFDTGGDNGDVVIVALKLR